MRKTAALVGIVLGGVILIIAFAIRFRWVQNPFVNGYSESEQLEDNGRQSDGSHEFSRQSNPKFKGYGRQKGRKGRRPSRQRNGRGWQRFISFFKGSGGEGTRQSGSDEMPSRQGTVTEDE